MCSVMTVVTCIHQSLYQFVDLLLFETWRWPPLRQQASVAMARWGGALLVLVLARPTSSVWQPPDCGDNADCSDGQGPEDGEVIEGTGISTLIWAAANMTN
jgi:hypothetical protein